MRLVFSLNFMEYEMTVASLPIADSFNPWKNQENAPFFRFTVGVN